MNRMLACFLPTLAISLTLVGCSRSLAKTDAASQAEVPVRAARATSTSVPEEIAAVGNVEATSSVAVRSRVAGPVALVAFHEGDDVEKGQLLFRIDREVLERQAIEQHALAERDAAIVEQSRAMLARDEASAKQSRSEAEVARKLGDLGVLSGQRVNQLATARDTAGAAMTADEASLSAAQATLRADRARLGELELQQRLTDVTAPISGRAGAVMVKAGNLVTDSGTILVNLLKLSPVYVAFSVPEQSLRAIQQRQTQAELTVAAEVEGGASIEGKLAFVDNTVDATTGAIRLKALFPNETHALWPGAFVHVRLRLHVDESKTVIPSACVEEGITGKYVWVVHGGRAEMRAVSVQRLYARVNMPSLAVIANGLRPGEVVVMEGQLRLTPGARVSIQRRADA